MGRNADVNQKSKERKTPLHIASEKGFDHVAMALLKHHAHINLLVDSGSSPLYLACQNSHVSVVKLLIKRNANVNQCNKLRATPLFIACARGHKNVVNIMLKSNADVNITTSKGHTPFSVARLNGHDNIAEILTNTAYVIPPPRTKNINEHTNGHSGRMEVPRLQTIYSVEEETTQTTFRSQTDSISDLQLQSHFIERTGSFEINRESSKETYLTPELIHTTRSESDDSTVTTGAEHSPKERMHASDIIEDGALKNSTSCILI